MEGYSPAAVSRGVAILVGIVERMGERLEGKRPGRPFHAVGQWQAVFEVSGKSSMRILMQTRADYDRIRGGDTVQMEKTRQELRKLGVEADVSVDPAPDLTGYDLVHIFNLVTADLSYTYARNAHRQGVPFAVSTIYCDHSEYNRRGRPFSQRLLYRLTSEQTVEWVKNAFRRARSGQWGRYDATPPRAPAARRRWIVENAAVVLPNSASEAAALRGSLGARYRACVVVPNGVDVDDLAGTPPLPWRERRPSVLCVARLDAGKNLLLLVEAVRRMPGVTLTLAGPRTSMHAAYAARVLRRLNGRMEYVGTKTPAELVHWYGRSKVHALVSWMETTGLVSLEAAWLGCSLVVTDRGGPRDYLGDAAEYCEPDSVSSCVEAIERALQREPDGRLRDRIVSEYNWKKAAERTLEGYQLALARPTAKAA